MWYREVKPLHIEDDKEIICDLLGLDKLLEKVDNERFCMHVGTYIRVLVLACTKYPIYMVVRSLIFFYPNIAE